MRFTIGNRWHEFPYPANRYPSVVSLQFVSTNYPETTVLVFTEQYGANGTIQWYADYDDGATLDRVGKQLYTYEGYNALVGKSKGYFIPGSLRDSLLMSV